MGMFNPDSLEELRGKIDLVEVISPHVPLKRAGASYKACCPFHNEKTPSFVIQKGDSHYHCFGCGAHGDAIAFLMGYLKMSFVESVETLAEKFNVKLESVEREEVEHKGPRPTQLKEALNKFAEIFNYLLLHTDEGHQALSYLYKRGIDLDFITKFQLGYAPSSFEAFFKLASGLKVPEEVLEAAGLIKRREDGKLRPFFVERITFPICDAFGNVIGFSARKLREEAFGGKYINTPETILFKKSKTLIGLKECRRRIAKDKKVIIVEGHIDAFRLIQVGLNFTVAACGTAFGESHVKELTSLGVSQAYLAFDGDDAGREAAVKVGNLLQKEGVEVFVIELAKGSDPDTVVRTEGPDVFITALEKARKYLPFLVDHFSRQFDFESPAGKNEIVRTIVAMIRSWNHPLMVHEGLKRLAQLCQVPESVIDPKGGGLKKRVYVKQSATLDQEFINPDRILETDLLRWLLLVGQNNREVVELALANLKGEDFHILPCRKIFEVIISGYQETASLDLLSVASNLGDAEQQQFLAEILHKRINPERAKQGVCDTIGRLLERNWMQRREEIKLRIQSGLLSEDEVLELAKQFDAIKSSPPKVMTCLESSS